MDPDAMFDHSPCCSNGDMTLPDVTEQDNIPLVSNEQLCDIGKPNDAVSPPEETIWYTFDTPLGNGNFEYPIVYPQCYYGHWQRSNMGLQWSPVAVDHNGQTQSKQISYRFGTDDRIKEHQIVLEVTDEFLLKRSKPPICVVHELEHHLCLSVGFECATKFDYTFPKQQTIHMHVTGHNITAHSVATARNKREAKHIAACLMLNGLISSKLIKIFCLRQQSGQMPKMKLIYTSDVFRSRKQMPATDLDRVFENMHMEKSVNGTNVFFDPVTEWQNCQPMHNVGHPFADGSRSVYEKNRNVHEKYQASKDAMETGEKKDTELDEQNDGSVKSQVPVMQRPPNVNNVQEELPTASAQSATKPSEDAEKTKRESLPKTTVQTEESSNENSTKEEVILYRKPRLSPSPPKKTVNKRKRTTARRNRC
uniref:DRBM domain-containing protein n=1 Tax=Trichuris muris TaxID=70415 RepID=A0A5S6R0K5_TRIMR